MTSPAPSRLQEARPWEAGPSRPHLRDRGLEVWRADLRATSDATLRWLASDERARAARFPVAARGRLWAHARGVLRALLGAYLEEDPRALRFEADAGGKPRLAGHPDRAISFNLSHSGSHALFAFARAGAVGIDIECARPGTDRLALAARAFGPSAARRLRTLEDSEREREFLAMWVRREAVVKCLGGGVWEALASQTAGGAAGDDEPGSGTPRSPWIVSLALGEDVRGAVASSEPPLAVRCWAWRDERHARLGGAGRGASAHLVDRPGACMREGCQDGRPR